MDNEEKNELAIRKFEESVNLPTLERQTETEVFELMQRQAKLYAASTMAPDHYRGNVSNCFFAFEYAKALNISPVLFMQKSYALKGKIGIEAQLAVSLVNRSGKIKDRIMYEFSGSGDDRKCRAYAVTESGVTCDAECSVQLAKNMGWFQRSDHWKHNTDQMLAYRAASLMTRRHFPEIIGGLYTVDELRDMEAIEVRPIGAPRRARLAELPGEEE
jgi:hypothetical protein